MKKYLFIKEKIKTMIEKIEVNNPIPSERRLALHFRTTRTTIRQAIDQLENEGLVYRTVGRKGTLVAERQLQVPHNQIIGFKEQIKRMGMKPGYRILRKIDLEADAFIAKQLSIKEGERIILVERVCLVNGLPVSVEETYMPFNMFPELLSTNPFPPSLYQYIEDYLDSKIKNSTQMISAVVANKEYAKLLEIKEHEALIFIENIAKLQDGSVFEYSRTYQVGKRYKLYLSINQ